MRIKSLKIKDFRNLRLVEMDDIPDLVVLAGANGCGKTALLEAIVLAKETMGQYGERRVDVSQLHAGADHCEIELSIQTSEAERAKVAVVVTQGLPMEAHGKVRLSRANGPQILDWNTTNFPGLEVLFRTYERRDAPDVGVVEYFPSTRRLLPERGRF